MLLRSFCIRVFSSGVSSRFERSATYCTSCSVTFIFYFFPAITNSSRSIRCELYWFNCDKNWLVILLGCERHVASGTSMESTPSAKLRARVFSATALPAAISHAANGTCSGGSRFKVSAIIFCKVCRALSISKADCNKLEALQQEQHRLSRAAAIASNEFFALVTKED